MTEDTPAGGGGGGSIKERAASAGADPATATAVTTAAAAAIAAVRVLPPRGRCGLLQERLEWCFTGYPPLGIGGRSAAAGKK
jgi:hypothetical protein